MLVLSRYTKQRIIIGGGDSDYPEVVVELCSARKGFAQLGIDAPKEIPVHREEVICRIERDGRSRSLITADGLSFKTAAINKRSSQ